MISPDDYILSMAPDSVIRCYRLDLPKLIALFHTVVGTMLQIQKIDAFRCPCLPR
jgi:hypothetical protein